MTGMDYGERVERAVSALLKRYYRKRGGAYSGPEMERMFDGITQKDVSRWHRGDYQPGEMETWKFRAIMDVLGWDYAKPGDGNKDPG